jgi:hypothetical protein
MRAKKRGQQRLVVYYVVVEDASAADSERMRTKKYGAEMRKIRDAYYGTRVGSYDRSIESC